MTYGFVSMLYLQQMSKESKKMSTLSKSSSFLRGALVLTAALGCAAVAMSAQTTDEASTTAVTTVNTAIPASSAYSTSADETVAQPANTNLALNVAPFNFMNAMQYGSGSRSGAPRYRGGNSNADGSSRWIFFGGGGLASPIGNTHKYFTDSWGFQGGFGRQFSKKFAVPIEFDYDHFGMSGYTLTNEEQVYATMATQYNNAPGSTGGAVATRTSGRSRWIRLRHLHSRTRGAHTPLKAWASTTRFRTS